MRKAWSSCGASCADRCPPGGRANIIGVLGVGQLPGQHDMTVQNTANRVRDGLVGVVALLVVATSDQPAMLRMKCPSVATSIAEYFRDQGYDVLLMMDSLTRSHIDGREVVAVGQLPGEHDVSVQNAPHRHQFLCQGIDEAFSYEESLKEMRRILE